MCLKGHVPVSFQVRGKALTQAELAPVPFVVSDTVTADMVFKKVEKVQS